MYTEVVIDLMFLCCFLFFCFNDPAPTEIYTYGHTLPYTTLFRSLDRLPARIDALAAEAAALEQRLADPALYKKNPAGFDEITRTLAAKRRALATPEERWMELEAEREAHESG